MNLDPTGKSDFPRSHTDISITSQSMSYGGNVFTGPVTEDGHPTNSKTPSWVDPCSAISRCFKECLGKLSHKADQGEPGQNYQKIGTSDVSVWMARISDDTADTNEEGKGSRVSVVSQDSYRRIDSFKWGDR